MSETEISHNPEGHPPEPTGGSSSSAPEAPRAAPRPKPKIGDTRPAPVVAAPPPPEVDAPVVPLKALRGRCAEGDRCPKGSRA